MESLPVVSYGRVTDLANSYRQRIAGDICKTVPDNPLGVEERIGSILTGESDRLCTIESEEEEILAIMERWMRRNKTFLEKQIYREEFLRFWEKLKYQSQHCPVHPSKFFMIAYRYNTSPFAMDPVECWERGIVVPPELKQPVEISDGEGTVSLPPFHELPMRFREAYNHYRRQ
ncbi:hypothetical protein LSM04_008016 [Trypanosoma melophagium]|uniref:uncharacterized protein n=1 Tax=Trypanosoma melophagium TaxID=715481 RepID=UPI00351A032C|nr:hypothetical protein LSM04_008016 [Trypanosoma melophagium]